MAERQYYINVGRGVMQRVTGAEQITYQAEEARRNGLVNKDGFPVATKPGDNGWRDPDREPKIRLGKDGKDHGQPGENTAPGVSYWSRKELEEKYHSELRGRL